MSRKERMQAIVQSMDKFHYQFGGIQMVVIDGIADLVRCANDEAESIGVIDELYRLAGIYKTCIVCVLHSVYASHGETGFQVDVRLCLRQDVGRNRDYMFFFHNYSFF
jgi:hypothetical protein